MLWNCLQPKVISRVLPAVRASSSSTQPTADNDKPWLNPWKRALPKQKVTYTGVEELPVDWSYVERLLPIETIPPIPNHDKYPTPSGWQPPRNPPPELPYFVERRRDHMFPLYLERKRDELNEKTLDFEYVELVTVRNIDGDVFAFDKDMRAFLDKKLGHPVASHVDELKGRIKVKGADRSQLEAFLLHQGF